MNIFNNILEVSVIYTSLILIVGGIYFYPIYNFYIYYLVIGSIISSVLNHFSRKHGKIKRSFQFIDRLTVRITGCIYMLLSNKMDGSEVIIYERYHTTTCDIIFYGIISCAMCYSLTVLLTKKKKHYPKNLSKIPHALCHVFGTFITLFIYYETSLSMDDYSISTSTSPILSIKP
jgi:hypothetical protein